MKRLFLGSILFLLAPFYLQAGASVAGSESAPHDKNTSLAPPRLVVKMVISQFRYDYLTRYRHNFTAGGFNRLLEEGAVCVNARYQHMFTQTSPGVTTLVTGAYPSQHGIIGESWVNYTTNEIISSVGDLRMKGVGCTEDEGHFSPHRMIVNTVGDELKGFDQRSKVISVSLDPASAVLAGGHSANAVYWFDPHYGQWATSTYYTTFLPAWMESYNQSTFKERYLDKLWSVSLPLERYTSKDRTDIQLDSVLKVSFDLLLKPRNLDFDKLTEIPFGNSMLQDFAMQVIRFEELGKDSHPDLLIVNYSATKAISQKYGTLSVEMEDAVYRMDRDVERMLRFLDEEVGQGNYLVVLTSDHGSSSTQPLASRIPSGKFNAMQFRVLISGFMNAQFGDGTWVSDYKNRQLYLNRRMIYEKGLSLEDIQQKVATFALQFNGVANAVTASSLQSNYYGDGLLRRIQNSFFPKHSGDIIINLQPGWVEIEAEGSQYQKLSDSGSPYEYDIHVPLIWYGAGIRPGLIYEEVDMVDVAPTVCDFLQVNHPNSSVGKAVKEVIAGRAATTE